MSLLDLLSALATAVSALLISGFVKACVEAARASRAVDRSANDRPEEIVRAASLDRLGAYVYDEIGSLPLARYASDERARQVVARAVETMDDFVMGEGATAEGATTAPTPERDLEAATAAISQGRVWDGLARLRRAIEVHLRSLARERDIPAERAGAGRLLADLVRLEAIPPEVVDFLGPAIRVANSGIHGYPVSRGEAEEALANAQRGLVLLP